MIHIESKRNVSFCLSCNYSNTNHVCFSNLKMCLYEIESLLDFLSTALSGRGQAGCSQPAVLMALKGAIGSSRVADGDNISTANSIRRRSVRTDKHLLRLYNIVIVHSL